MAQEQDARVYHGLDLLRGIAALSVVLYHYRLWFPGVRILDHAYLAVDFFFVLSGYVLAHAYATRLVGSMTLREFVVVRAIRLYPLLILGTCLGFAHGLLDAALHPEKYQIAVLVGWFALGLVGLPIPEGSGPGRQFFPLNWPAWSLFFEMVINFIFAVSIAHLDKKRLWLTIVIAASILGLTAWNLGQINLGRGWWFFLSGFARSAATFFLGVALFQMRSANFVPRAIGRFKWVLPTWVGAALLVATLIVPVTKGDLNAAYDLFCVLVIFPLIIFGVSRDDAVGPNAPGVGFGREFSYAIYILHFPCLRLAVLGLRSFDVDLNYFRIPLAVGLTALVMAVAYLAVRLIEYPVRRWLSRRRSGGNRSRA